MGILSGRESKWRVWVGFRVSGAGEGVSADSVVKIWSCFG
jgi:hypothetical protein